MTAVLLLFNVLHKGDTYTLKVERNFEVDDEQYTYEIAKKRSLVQGPDGQPILSTWVGGAFSEWTEAIGAGLEAIESNLST